jgi:hypothetical protein
MPEAVLIAAGGGGDVIAAAAIARALGMEPRDALIATLAWERLIIDPTPGPRSPAEFSGLSTLGHQNVEIVDATELATPGTSMLPRLRRELGHRIVVLDPRRGVTGLAEQLGELAATVPGGERSYLIDVGGDVLATGLETGLKSPLADALTLAACAHLGSSVDLLVAGPGLDGELTEEEVLTRLQALGAFSSATLSQEATSSVLGVLEWHPSEATALLVAAARGLEGMAEIRDAGTQIPLTERGSLVWSMPAQDAMRGSVAELLLDTVSFQEAEDTVRQQLGWTELDGERRKAIRMGRSTKPATNVDAEVLRRVATFESEAKSRGTNFVTFRRLAEAVGHGPAYQELRGWLLGNAPNRHRPPLWSLTE